MVPVPRFLGRSHAGERRSGSGVPRASPPASRRGRCREPPGRRSRLAALRSPARRRTARSRRRPGRWSCRRRWRRTAGTGRVRQVVEVDGDGVGEGTEGGDLEVVEPHGPPSGAATSTSKSGSSQHASTARRSPRLRRRQSCPACRRRSRGRCRGRSGPSAGPRGPRSPVAKPSTSVCGKRPRNRSIAWTGRESSVRVACTQAPSCEAGIGEQLLERPGRGPPAGDRRLDELAGPGRRARAPPARSPCGAWPRRRSTPAATRCSGSSRSACAARAGGRGPRSRCRRTPTSARSTRHRR